jgi:hypothetical protein
MPLVAGPDGPEDVTVPPAAPAWPLLIRSSLQRLVLVRLLPLAGLAAPAYPAAARARAVMA